MSFRRAQIQLRQVRKQNGSALFKNQTFHRITNLLEMPDFKVHFLINQSSRSSSFHSKQLHAALAFAYARNHLKRSTSLIDRLSKQVARPLDNADLGSNKPAGNKRLQLLQVCSLGTSSGSDQHSDILIGHRGGNFAQVDLIFPLEVTRRRRQAVAHLQSPFVKYKLIVCAQR